MTFLIRRVDAAAMNRSIQILSVFLLLTLASVVRAQTPSTCGIVGIDGPPKVQPGMSLVFKVRTAGLLHTTKPEFKWTVSVGTITNGQGTDEITIDISGLGGQELTATVELFGAPLGCNRSDSKTIQIEPPPFSCCRLFDEYGDLKFEDEKARLDNFAIHVSNSELSTGYILTSAGKETYENEASERLDRAKSYIVKVRGLDSGRVITVDCGFNSELTTKLFVADFGMSPPQCSVFNEVPISEVKFTKPRPKASKKRR